MNRFQVRHTGQWIGVEHNQIGVLSRRHTPHRRLAPEELRALKRRHLQDSLTPRIVEVFLKGERIAAHRRSSGNHHHTTVPAHMPSSHRRYADWTVERIRREAATIGPATAALCELILEHRLHPEQGFRSCLGIVRLVRPFGADRLEAAATRAIEIGTLTDGSVRSILDNKLDRQTAQSRSADAVTILHPNIRGPRYYH